MRAIPLVAFPALVALAALAALAVLPVPIARADETPPAAAEEPAPAAPPAAEGKAQEIEEVEEVEEEGVEELGDVFVTATREPARTVEVPRSVNVLDAERILERGVITPADALDDQIGVWVEKRTAHTSDFVIRGLSGGNLLALVDGNTLSTFWGEGGFAGDDMYGKVDPEIVERIEVVRGPSSVLYGSNALGGVVNFITRESPFDWLPGRGVRVGARSRVVASSAPEYGRFRQEVYGATRNLRWIGGVTVWRSGDTQDGSGQWQHPTWGRGFYADARLDWRVTRKVEVGVTVHHTDNDVIHRYYRPNEDNSNLRTAVAATVRATDLRAPLADTLRFTAYLQDKEDRRRYFDATTKALTKSGVARWQTVQVDLQASKRAGRHEWTYGVELESTDGESPDDEQFTITPVGGSPAKAAPDSVWSSLGVYVQDVWKPTHRLAVTGSLRVDGFRFATDVDDQYHPAGGLDPLVDEFVDHKVGVVGGLQAAYALRPDTHVYGGWTRGFRQFAPRFGVAQHAGFGVVVPSRLLDPITADQYEVGLKHEGEHARAEVVGYYTSFHNFQNLLPGTFLGQDWYDFDQDTVRDPNETVYQTVGNGDAHLYGVEAYGEVGLSLLSRRLRGWTVGAGFMANRGQDDTNAVPMRHTHPRRGVFKLRYHREGLRTSWFVELAAEFVGRYDRIPPDRMANDVGYLVDPQVPSSGKLRPWGLPGYSVWDLRAGISICDDVSVVVGIDNLFDKLYRPAHSRWDAPGRSFYVSLEARF